MIRFVWEETITNLFEKETIVSGKKNKDDDSIELVRENEGWFVQCGDISYGVGKDRPPFQVGDRLRFSMEKIK